MVMVNFFGHFLHWAKMLARMVCGKEVPNGANIKEGLGVWVGVGKIYLIEQCQNRKKTLFIKVASFNNAVPCKPSSYQTQFVIVKVPKNNEK